MKPRLFLMLALTSLVTAPARADNKAEAREYFTQAAKYYDLNEYAQALAAFKNAYLKYEDPGFLFNIAQCHRQLNQKSEAIKFYRTYLRKVPSSPKRASVERLIAELETALEQERLAAGSPPHGMVAPEAGAERPPSPAEPQPQTQPQPSPPVASPATSSPTVTSTSHGPAPRTLFYSGIGVAAFGVASIAAAGGLVAGAKSANQDITSSGTFNQPAQDRRNLMQSLDVTFFVVGAAALVAGTTLIVLGRRATERRLTVAPILAPSRVGAAVQGSF
jgi:tetratricopeptide (TPR) repeat protein